MEKERFFEWELIGTGNANSGVKKTTCPACSHTRKKKKDPCLYVNLDSGVAKCYNCDRLSFRDSEISQGSWEFTLPPQDWTNYTKLHKKIVDFCESRKIRQETLIHFGITQESVWMPQRSEKVNAIVFNYFENGTIVNKKYRDLSKNFTQSKGGKSIFYNINQAIGAEKVYIVEGEFDVLAMYEAGVKNVISLPSGANDNDGYWENSKKYLKDVESFVIAVDRDEKGELIKEKIAHRLGKHRCTFIEWNGKDANDDLISGVIQKSLKSEKHFPVSGTFTVGDVMDDVMELYRNGVPETIAPRKKAFQGFDKIFSTMTGQMTVVTGIPSHGKSNFIEWYVLNLIHEYDLKTSLFSPEHSPMALHFTTLMQKAIGKSFFGTYNGYEKIQEEDIKRFEEWSKERLYLTGAGAGETVDWDWLLSKFEEQIFTFGINIFVIDAWNKVQMPKGYEGKDGIDRVITRITAFCQQNNVQIFLVAHPTKMQKDKKTGDYELPQLYDVSGSADFRNQTHNGCSVYRNFKNERNSEDSTDFFNLKTKMSFQGEIGAQIRFKYHTPTSRYFVDECPPYNFDMTIKGAKEPIDFKETPVEVQNVPETEKIHLNDFRDYDFDKVDDKCPF